jgi:outer membrane protein TolC
MRRGDIASMEKDAAMQEAMSESMRTGLRPDIMVGGMAMIMPDGMPGWGVMAGLTLPFVPWAKGMATGEAAGTHARSRATQSKAESMKRMAHAEVIDHANKARAAWNGLSELDTLVLPGQENAIADARARYAQGREMLSMVLAMQDMALMTRMEAAMRRGEYELERARLLAAAGLESFGQAGAR